MIDETLFEAEEKMEKAVSVAREDLTSIRTGRANPSMFNKILVDYYGAPTPVNQLASFHVADARISIRNVRRHAKDELDRLAKDGEAGEDDVNRAEKELEKVTHKYVGAVDDLLKHKEAELLEV